MTASWDSTSSAINPAVAVERGGSPGRTLTAVGPAARSRGVGEGRVRLGHMGGVLFSFFIFFFLRLSIEQGYTSPENKNLTEIANGNDGRAK